MENDSSTNRISFWEEKFNDSLNEHIKIQLNINPDLDITIIKEQRLISKMATLMVGCELLGKQVRDLEIKLNISNS